MQFLLCKDTIFPLNVEINSCKKILFVKPMTRKKPQSVWTVTFLCVSAMTELISFYPRAATCLQRADFKLAALFWWMMLVLANLSNIFCTVG